MHPAKLFFKTDRKIKHLHDKENSKKCMITKSKSTKFSSIFYIKVAKQKTSESQKKVYQTEVVGSATEKQCNEKINQ